MGYSSARLKKTLGIFHLAEKGDDAGDDNNIEKILRAKRSPRKSLFGPGLSMINRQDAYSTDEDDDNDTEFNPDAKKQKLVDVNAAAKNRKLKRKAEDGPDGEKAAKAAKNATTELTKEERKTDRIAFATLMLGSDKSMRIQQALAEEHGNNVRDIVFEHVHDEPTDRRTYFDQLDQEAALIDNEKGRALRNRKVAEIKITEPKMKEIELAQTKTREMKINNPKTEKIKAANIRATKIKTMCPRCRYFMENCKCHEALIVPDEGDEDDDSDEALLRRRPKPTVVPATRRASTLRSQSRSNGIWTPTSIKGKDRAASLSPPPDIPTPPASVSQASSVSKSRTSSSNCTLPGCPELATSSKASPPASSQASFSSRNMNPGHFPSLSPNIAFTGASINNPVVLDDAQADLYAKEFKLRTRWSHPIDFRYTNDLHHGPCKFCQNFRYGVFGEDERNIKVIQDPSSNSFQYVEVVGNNGDQPDLTRMCPHCALDRLYISDCPSHFFDRLELPPEMDRDAYLDLVFDINGPPVSNPLYEMCSLCPHPAVIKCTANQTHDKMRCPIPESNNIGCGLRLCKGCWRMLRDLHGMLRKRRIEDYVKRHNKENEHKITLRADAEFLYNNSLLQKAYPRKK